MPESGNRGAAIVGGPRIYPVPDLPANWESAVLPIDKPAGITSFGVIRRLRRILDVRKIGHAGTLDPMATGLLIMLVGRATRSMERFMGMPKEYAGTITFGATTSTWDAESDVIERRDISQLTDDTVREASSVFIGTIRQLTPAFSAVKMGGERLYRKARRGESFALPERIVEIESFRLGNLCDGTVDFVVRCSKGTYVRSLAHELGQRLGVGAHLSALRRTAIGELRVEQAWTLDDLSAATAAPEPD